MNSVLVRVGCLQVIDIIRCWFGVLVACWFAVSVPPYYVREGGSLKTAPLPLLEFFRALARSR